MTPHDLLAAFETLAEAPDGITRLRELVLQLAVRGKLVPQDPNDEPACVLLERVAAERAQLVKEGKIPKAKPLLLVGEDEVPFVVPEGWVWTRTQELTIMVTDGDHVPPPKSDTGIPFAVIGNISGGVIDLTDTRYVPLDYYKSLDWIRKPVKGDLLYTVTGSFGIVVPVDTDAEFCVQRHIGILKTSTIIANGYLRYALSSPSSRDFAESVATGIAQKTVPLAGLRKLPVPLPPLPEQHRIVAKVDALISLLDRLEAARSERETTRASLRNAALAALRDAPDAEAVEAAWTRIAECLDDLFTDPADVAPLRQTILQLAVRGQLVPQDPSDEPACLLLERIAADKVQLVVKEGKLQKPKLLRPVGEDGVPFKVPAGWAWCRLDELLVEGPTNGWSPKTVDFETPTRTLRLSATTRGTFDGSYFKYVDTVLAESSPLWLRYSDLLIQRSNTPEYVGIAAIYDGEDGQFIYPDLMMRCRVTPTASVRFVHLALISPIGRSWFHGKASGTSKSMVKVSQTVVSSTPILLPPLPEQHRIVAKVDALMTLCDALGARLAAAREAQAAFAAAAVHHLDT